MVEAVAVVAMGRVFGWVVGGAMRVVVVRVGKGAGEVAREGGVGRWALGRRIHLTGLSLALQASCSEPPQHRP